MIDQKSSITQPTYCHVQFPMANSESATPTAFSSYQKFIVAILAFLQFVVILDFMLISPLGAMIIPAINITTEQFGYVVSAYAFSAALSGLLTAGFADRYDRKKILLFFYIGFLLGTLWCGLAQSYESLLFARIVAGLFGGVIGSIVLAIATDLFAPNMRGRVMGVIQTAFSASQILGLPISLYLSNKWNWHLPFIVLAIIGVLGIFLIAKQVKPIVEHLKMPQEHNPFKHLLNTVAEPKYLIAFVTTSLVMIGGFMLMPLSSVYIVHNLGIDLQHLPMVYMVTGVATIFMGPIIGKATDTFGKFRVFFVGTLISIVLIFVYTHLPQISLLTLIIVNTVMFMGIFSRMIPYQAFVSTIPAAYQRGSFNAISASIQQLSGGLASVAAGMIVNIDADGKLAHFDTLGYIVIGTSILSLFLVWVLQRTTK